MKETYILKINSKYLNKLLKYNVSFYKIKYQKDICFLYVNYNDYSKLIKYKDIYGISLYKVLGLPMYKSLIKNNLVFIISIIIGIVFFYILSNIIFDIKIMSNNKDIIKIINMELEEADFRKYRFVKSFKEKEILKNKILNDYKDKIEWLEIDLIGTKYYIKVLERVINKENTVNYQSIVARKNAVIKEIKASNGSVIKKVNDYVNKGDEIISGYIKKGDDIKNIVEARGSVYGETWYNVKVILPRTYKIDKYTNNSYTRLSINFLNKKIILFKNKNYELEEYIDYPIINNNLLPISINKTIIKEKNYDTYFYTYQDALSKGMILAKEKLMNELKKDSKILLQKKLKLYEENSTIVIEVFFKVYEDITDYKSINRKDDINGNNN